MFDHTKQFRCDIVRGKTLKEIDNILPAYAKIINDTCPCTEKEFNDKFNEALKAYLPTNISPTLKTLNNHRSEIAGKLFGMYYKEPSLDDGDVYVHISERTLKFIEDNDQPAFFKDVCFRMQFPNGMTKLQKLKERIEMEINVRPNSYVLKVLSCAKDKNVIITNTDIGYYVLNALEVLQSKADPMEIVNEIINDKDKRIIRKICTKKKASSWNMQHINEQLNYLELSNLITVNSDGIIELNPHEAKVIKLFADLWNQKPEFDVYSYQLTTKAERKKFFYDWDKYFSHISSKSVELATTISSLGIHMIEKSSVTEPKGNSVEFGDEGEMYVYQYEKERVRSFDTRLANKVVHLGKTRGLGYDIQSVIAEKGNMAEFVKYIEVKSTKRVTEPDIQDSAWIDTLNITRNEWIAAQQHKDFYSIYRVYFIRGNIIMYVIKNVCQKEKDGLLKVVPMTYRVDFGNSAIDYALPQK
nr:DUF3883 domain-containing protein [Bacilli bacterium]